MADTRSYAGGRFGLVVDGSEFLGYVKSVSGGNIKAEVAVHQLGPDNVQKKHIIGVNHEAFKIDVGMGMSKGFYEWIRQSFDRSHMAKSGELVACDFDYKAQSVREFTDALITEVTIPALDGSSKDPAYMSVTFEPERIRYRKGDGNQISGTVAPATKLWQCANFRFELGDLPCSRIAKIDSFTWKQGVTKDQVGQFREATKHPTKVEVPNLKLTGSMADVEKWQEWHRTFVIEGKCAEGDELTGAITFLGPDMEQELARIEISHVGIISLQQAQQEANSEKIAQFEVELYVEEMKFNYSVADA
ncbi:MAG TPA: hypothetical protein VFG83_01960 [Kofleriaceae bacterium]|nr:hypothetical protein [Kofleriaceae bacterium]